MKCAFEYCIYNEEFACILNEVEMNSIGQCKDCIIVSFPEEKLAEYKRKQMQEIMSRYENSDK